MRRTTLYQTSPHPLSISYRIKKNNQDISDIYEVLSPNEDNLKKIILFLVGITCIIIFENHPKSICTNKNETCIIFN